MNSSQSFLCLWSLVFVFSLCLYLAGDDSGLIRRASPFPLISNDFKGLSRALNLPKKIEYTARIAPAQLGKATVNRYRKPAATGWDCFSGLDISVGMGIHASIVYE